MGGVVLFLGILFFLQFSIFPQSSSNYKKIYLETLESGSGVKSEVSTRIRNLISLNILRYFKERYTLIDDSVVQGLLNQLKKQQNLGCDTDKCYRMIEDNLSPDEKIVGNLQVQGGRYILTLKLLDVSRGGGVVEQKEVSFTNAQLEYFLTEITRALLDRRYSINTEGAPQEYSGETVNLSKLEVKEIQGVDLKILDFKGSDTRTDEIIKILKEELQQGDAFFNQKNYSRALNTYENLQKNLDTSLTQESQKSILEYVEGIQKRVENTRINLLTEQTKEIDNKLKSGSERMNQTGIEKIIREYESIQFQATTYKLQKTELSTNLKERIKNLETALFQLQEKEGDSLYDTYKFSESLKIYENVLQNIKNSKRISNREKEESSGKISKKIAITRETGISYYANRVRTYCNLAETENLKVNLKRGKNESFSTVGIKENIRKAESIIRTNRLVDKQTVDYYNTIVLALNKSGDELGNLLTYDDIGKEKEGSAWNWDSFSYPPEIPRNLYLPGSLHEEAGKRDTADLVKIGFYSSAFLYTFQYFQFQSISKQYSDKNTATLDYLVLRNSDPGIGFLYFNSKNSELESLAGEGNRAGNLGNLFLLSTLGFYLYSWTPAISLFSSNNIESFHIVLQPKVVHRADAPEYQFGIEGRF